MARRRAASGSVTCCSRTSRTACYRNSFVYCCRGTCFISHLQTSHCRLKASTFSSLAQPALGRDRGLLQAGEQGALGFVEGMNNKIRVMQRWS